MNLSEITDLIVAVEKYDVCASPSATAPLGECDFVADGKRCGGPDYAWYHAKVGSLGYETYSRHYYCDNAKPGAAGDGTPDAFLKNTALKALRSLEAALKEMSECDCATRDTEIHHDNIKRAISTAWGENNGG